jgi:hypothetical protein
MDVAGGLVKVEGEECGDVITVFEMAAATASLWMKRYVPGTAIIKTTATDHGIRCALSSCALSSTAVISAWPKLGIDSEVRP